MHPDKRRAGRAIRKRRRQVREATLTIKKIQMGMVAFSEAFASATEAFVALMVAFGAAATPERRAVVVRESAQSDSERLEIEGIGTDA